MTDCEWMNANQEAYCCDRLTGEDLRRATSHIDACDACREELHQLNAVSPMVQELFQYRLAVARTRRTLQAPQRLVPATAAVALAGGVLAIVLLLKPATLPVVTQTPLPSPQTAAEQVIPKTEDAGSIDRAKPDAATPPAAPVSGAVAPNAANNAEPFAVVDPAGYVRRLEDYRGNVLVVGVWSPAQPQAARNLDDVFRAFTNNPNFRLVGVLTPRQGVTSSYTFPVVYNYDSRLLGIQESQFIVFDAVGKEQLRGSLLADTARLNQTVRALLER